MIESNSFLIESLRDDGVLDEADIRRAQEHAQSHDLDITESVVALGIVTNRQLAVGRAVICEYPFVDIDLFEVSIRNSDVFPRNVAERLVAFPLFIVDGVATVGMLDPLNLHAIDQIRQLMKMDVDPVLCDAEQLRALIARAFSLARTNAPKGGPEAKDRNELTTGDEPIVAAVNQIITSAVKAGASDVHISPDEHELYLRYRIDGVLHLQQGPAKSAHQGLVQRLKVMAKLDLTQTRRPQDGKIRFLVDEEPIDIRLSLLPTIHGENAVMRLLRPSSSIGSIRDISMPTETADQFEQMVNRPHGLILVTGPTGSGKTTTLYTALAHVNSPDQNIMTIEDPVEIRLPMIRQIQTNKEIGLTFASALRSILRQDPDVILVGEIRDEETGRIAVQSALTGHLVLSTLHTNDAAGAIARLRDFGIPPFAINSSLLCVIAQRLVRRLCGNCTEEDLTPDPYLLTSFGVSADRGFFKGAGCSQCMNTGYRGRVGVFEMLRMTQAMQALIDSEATTAELRDAAMADGMRLMWQDGLDKANLGLTSLSELTKLRTVVEAEQGAEESKRAA